jgi:transketolase
VLVISSGICTEEAMRAITVLRRRGVSLAHLHVATLKPFADPIVTTALGRRFSGIVTLENHSIIGGLGSAVAETMAELGASSRLIRLGLRDEYAHGASRPYLMRKYGIDALGLVGAVERLVGEHFELDPAELAAVPLDLTSDDAVGKADAGFAKAEDL